MDIIMPYRLEMGTKLKTNRGTSLYDFWDDLISMFLIDELSSHEKKVIINCESVEYFKAVNMKTVKTEVVTPVFKEVKNGEPRIISFFTKKARGAMARYIISNKISDVDGVISFNLNNYSYSESLSSKYEPVFIRYST